MALRLITLPRDFAPLGEMICDTFQYPENPEWSVQTDEKEQITHAIRSMRRIWPLFRVMQIVSPPMRDLFRGYVAVEDEKIVGVTLIQRRGTTDAWIVGTVGVLPEYRRRGLARLGLEKSLDLMRQHGATKSWLGVINGNTPAQRLYESLGFELYDGTVEYTLQEPELPDGVPLPKGYATTRLVRSDWKTRFELEQRIAPENTRLYEPVEKGRFRHPLMLRMMVPIMNLVQRTREADFVVRESSGGRVVARFGYDASKRGKGVNSIRIRLDPKHSDLAPYLVARLLRDVITISPNLRIELGVPRWMPAVAAAAESYGFVKRVEYLKMGRML
jgi:ribosomal protein S18 acetylase RimI-like enzyme